MSNNNEGLQNTEHISPTFTGHWQNSILAYNKGGVVHLPSSHDTLLELAEEKLAGVDLIFLQSQGVYKIAQREVTFDLSVPLSIY